MIGVSFFYFGEEKIQQLYNEYINGIDRDQETILNKQ